MSKTKRACKDMPRPSITMWSIPKTQNPKQPESLSPKTQNSKGYVICLPPPLRTAEAAGQDAARPKTEADAARKRVRDIRSLHWGKGTLIFSDSSFRFVEGGDEAYFDGATTSVD